MASAKGVMCALALCTYLATSMAAPNIGEDAAVSAGLKDMFSLDERIAKGEEIGESEKTSVLDSAIALAKLAAAGQATGSDFALLRARCFTLMLMNMLGRSEFGNASPPMDFNVLQEQCKKQAGAFEKSVVDEEKAEQAQMEPPSKPKEIEQAEKDVQEQQIAEEKKQIEELKEEKKQADSMPPGPHKDMAEERVQEDEKEMEQTIQKQKDETTENQHKAQEEVEEAEKEMGKMPDNPAKMDAQQAKIDKLQQNEMEKEQEVKDVDALDDDLAKAEAPAAEAPAGGANKAAGEPTLDDLRKKLAHTADLRQQVRDALAKSNMEVPASLQKGSLQAAISSSGLFGGQSSGNNLLALAAEL